MHLIILGLFFKFSFKCSFDCSSFGYLHLITRLFLFFFFFLLLKFVGRIIRTWVKCYKKQPKCKIIPGPILVIDPVFENHHLKNPFPFSVCHHCRFNHIFLINLFAVSVGVAHFGGVWFSLSVNTFGNAPSLLGGKEVSVSDCGWEVQYMSHPQTNRHRCKCLTWCRGNGRCLVLIVCLPL